MVKKQELLLFLKEKGDNVTFSEIEAFVNTKTEVTQIGFTQGSLWVDGETPVSFTSSDDLIEKIRELTLNKKVTARFNAVSKPNAQVALAVIKIFVEKLGYRIARLSTVSVDFVKYGGNLV